ncbi:Leucyl-tRNA synthetase [Candidatus Vidania fulgoroideae]|uniref:leucine--tRNA ligase n=1 Tax=Candidatus Vidania fulgoroideorum TaxID=881286 RepID=A0A346E0M0_9PROT|nr:Leucyl-tRNA synthetase [Candidatus Vidania fulgoroideae]
MNIIFNHKIIEKKKIENSIKKQNKFFVSMIPYPSGKLHLGHIRNYTINDIICRRLNIKMFMGWDSFGLPAENFSIRKKIKTKNCVKNNIKNMKKIMLRMGFNINWSKEFKTSSKKYYKYTQFFFLKFFQNGYIYKKKTILYWDSSDKTVLSREQIINGKGWRSGKKVTRKLINSYFIKLGKKLINSILRDIKKSKWPENIKDKQIKWIGKLNGNKFKNKNNVFFFKKKHFNSIIISFNNINFIKKFKKNNYISNFFKKKINEFDIKKKKLYFIGFKNIKNKKIPIFVYNKLKYNKYYHTTNINPFLKIEFLKNFNKKTKIYKIKKENSKKTSTYKILDWNISRQRYWGTPIPIIICKKCGLVPYKKLPLKINKLKYYNKKTLVKCTNCKKKSLKEKDTLDTFFDSSWYFLFFSSTIFFKKNSINKIDSKKINIYIGGEEHSILHLLYSRIFLKLLKKIKLLNFSEPFEKLIIQGLILNKTFFIKKKKKKKWIKEKNIKIYKKVYEGNIKKMSKSKKNGIDPKDYIKKFGADSLRMYIIFIAPIKKNFLWNGEKIIGCYRFIRKIWNFSIKFVSLKKKEFNFRINENFKKLYKKNSLNILVSELMIYFKILKNMCKKYKNNLIEQKFSFFLKNLYPICPFVSSYIWMMLKFNKKYKKINEN